MNELAQLHFAFTRERLKKAGAAAFFASLVALVGVLLSEEPLQAAPYATLLVVISGFFGYYGRSPERMLLASLLLGTLPLSCALVAQHAGHVCMNGGCTSLCVPLCSAGGLVAGGLLSRIAAHSRTPVVSWLSGASLVACCGAIGCSCVGASGIIAMALGLAVTSGGVVLLRPSAH